jgi:hypothetical protein
VAAVARSGGARRGRLWRTRHAHRTGAGATGHRKHRAWLASLRFGDRASQLTMADYPHATTCYSPAATGSSPSSSSSPPHRRGRSRSPGGAACAGSTRSRRWGCAPRSARSSASSTRQPELLPRDRALGEHHRPAASLGRDHQGRLHAHPPAADRSRLPLTSDTRRSAPRSSVANAANQPRSSASTGAPSGGRTPAGANSSTLAANPTASLRSRSPASSPALAGRSRSPTEKLTRGGRRGVLPASRTPTFRESPMSNPHQGGARC